MRKYHPSAVFGLYFNAGSNQQLATSLHKQGAG